MSVEAAGPTGIEVPRWFTSFEVEVPPDATEPAVVTVDGMTVRVDPGKRFTWARDARASAENFALLALRPLLAGLNGG